MSGDGKPLGDGESYPAEDFAEVGVLSTHPVDHLPADLEVGENRLVN